LKRISTQAPESDLARYARCIEISKRVRWEIDQDVIQGRTFNSAEKFLPDGLAKFEEFPSLSKDEMRFLSQIQGRTYANMFGLGERFINANVLELSQDHWLSDQVKLEALIRFSEEEIKHQELFRRIDQLIDRMMPEGYVFRSEPNGLAHALLGKSSWPVLGLTLLIEVVTQVHYRESIEPDEELSPLFKDVFRFHWLEESQHAVIDELEWRRIDEQLSPVERDQAVNEFIQMILVVDGILQAQATSDTEYFGICNGRPMEPTKFKAVAAGLLKAYRSQYVFSGANHPQFLRVLTRMVNDEQRERISAALARIG
jgi:hypothetical protein